MFRLFFPINQPRKIIMWEFLVLFISCRKLIVSKKLILTIFKDELLLSALVLSYSPKSERAWSHRLYTSWHLHLLLCKANVSCTCAFMLYLHNLLNPIRYDIHTYRRWVIKMIAGKHANLLEIVERESELVKKMAEVQT